MEQNKRFVLKSNDGRYLVVKHEQMNYGYCSQVKTIFNWIDDIEQADVSTQEMFKPYIDQFPSNSCRIVQVLRSEVQ